MTTYERTKYALLCTAALLGVAVESACAQGVTATWQQTAAGTYSWHDVANWDAERLPTNSADIVHLDIETDGAQTIRLAQATDIGTVFGHADQTISSPMRSGPYRAFKSINVANPNEFAGQWTSGDSGALWNVTPTADFTPMFASFDAKMRPAMYASSGCVRFGTITGGGMLFVHGGGNAQVDDVALVTRGRTRLRVPDGTTLSLGMASTFPSNAVTGAYVRFDAARADTLTLENGADGRTHVTEWRDAEGGDVKAIVTTRAAAPYLSTVKSIRGTPLVDFGAYRSVSHEDTWMNFDAFEAAAGPCGGLRFDETSEAREIFLVFEETIPSNVYPFALGGWDSYHLHRGPNGTLFHYGHADLPVRTGSVTLDGAPFTPLGQANFSRLHLVSLSTATGIKVGTLAIDRNQRFGGVRIAEAIIYTRALSEAERRQNISYLLFKWRPESFPEHDLDLLLIPGNGTVRVPTNESVTVDSLYLPRYRTLTKTGDGDLRVHDLIEDDISFTVRGGRLGFSASQDVVTDTAPAESPLFHLDASDAASLVETNVIDGTGRRYVARWNDTRGVADHADHDAGDRTFPYIVEGAANGRDVLDFGEGWIKEWGPTKTIADWGDASCGDTARLICSKAFNANAGFIVLRTKKLNGYSETDHAYLNPPMFGSSGHDFTRWGSGDLVTQYNSAAVQTALWEFDGKPFEPVDRTAPITTNEFLVVSFCSESRAMVNRIADDRLNAVGGVQIAEMLLYDRPLSPWERKCTQAYLMKKWKNAVHPALKSPVSVRALAFADGAAAGFEAERDVALGSVDTGGAKLTVKGRGHVTLPPCYSTAAGLCVDGGSVTIPADDPFADALYHFDASVTDSLDCEYVDNGNGTVTTNVVRWHDVRGNAVVATAFTNTATCRAYPVLRTVTTRNGHSMPVIDFGELSKAAAKIYKDSSAGMAISIPGWDGLMGEGHVVWCDAHGGCGDRFIFPDSVYYSVHRGENTSGQLFCAYTQNPYSQYIKDGYVAVDGVPRAYNYNMNDQAFHVVSLAPSNAIPNRLIGADRNNQRGGGSYQGELIVFASPLPAERREYLQRFLAWKWFGEGTSPQHPFCSLAALELVHGGTLTLTGTMPYACSSIKVEGAATMNGVLTLEEGGMLDFAVNDTNDVACLTVNGMFALPSSGTLKVQVGAGFAGATGSFPLITATELVGNVTGWIRDFEKEADVGVRVHVSDNTLLLDVLPSGMIIILR
jgi:hypothetical protein